MTKQVQLTSAIALQSDVDVYRTPTGFILTGYTRNVPNSPPFVQVSWQGETASTSFDVNSIDLLLGVAPISDDAGHDRLLVVDRGPGQSNLFGIRATTWSIGAADRLSERVFLHADYYGQVVTYAIGRSFDGKRVLYTYGNRIVDQGPALAEFGPEGVEIGETRMLSFTSKNWDSSQIVPTATSAALSAFATSEDYSKAYWHIVELDDGGAVSFQAAAPIEGIDGFLVHNQIPVIRSGNDYLARLPSTDSPSFLRIHRSSAPDAPVEIWQPNIGAQANGAQFAAFDNGFLVFGRDGTKLVVQRADSEGAPFATPLVVGDVTPYTTASVFAVENTTAYLAYLTDAARVIVAIDCPKAP